MTMMAQDHRITVNEHLAAIHLVERKMSCMDLDGNITTMTTQKTIVMMMIYSDLVEVMMIQTKPLRIYLMGHLKSTMVVVGQFLKIICMMSMANDTVKVLLVILSLLIAIALLPEPLPLRQRRKLTWWTTNQVNYIRRF